MNNGSGIHDFEERPLKPLPTKHEPLRPETRWIHRAIEWLKERFNPQTERTSGIFEMIQKWFGSLKKETESKIKSGFRADSKALSTEEKKTAEKTGEIASHTIENQSTQPTHRGIFDKDFKRGK